MIGIGIGMNEVAGAEAPAAGEDAPRHDVALLGAAMMM